MTKRITSIPPMTSIQEEWFLEPVEPLTRRNDGDTRRRFETDDGSALLTDFQRVALRWLSSFD
jgi:hypothetical protein